MTRDTYKSEVGPTIKAPHREPKTMTEEAVGTYHSLSQTNCHYKTEMFLKVPQLSPNVALHRNGKPSLENALNFRNRLNISQHRNILYTSDTFPRPFNLIAFALSK